MYIVSVWINSFWHWRMEPKIFSVVTIIIMKAILRDLKTMRAEGMVPKYCDIKKKGTEYKCIPLETSLIG